MRLEDFPADLVIRELHLQARKVAASMEIPELDLRVDRYERWAGSLRHLVYTVVAYVAGQKFDDGISHELVARYPASWWQHVKLTLYAWIDGRRWLRWRRLAWRLRRRWPAQMVEERSSFRADLEVFFPGLEIPPGGVVTVRVYEPREFRARRAFLRDW